MSEVKKRRKKFSGAEAMAMSRVYNKSIILILLTVHISNKQQHSTLWPWIRALTLGSSASRVQGDWRNDYRHENKHTTMWSIKKYSPASIDNDIHSTYEISSFLFTSLLLFYYTKWCVFISKMSLFLLKMMRLFLFLNIIE